MKKNLLQEAIAEAKQVREAAIEHAYRELEENLTPAIKEMLSSKLEEELDLEENDEESLDEMANSGFKEVKVKKSPIKEAEEDDAEGAADGAEADAAEQDADVAEKNADDAEAEADAAEQDADAAEEAADDAEKDAELADDDKIENLTVGQLKDVIADILAAANPAPAPEGEMGADMEPGDVEGQGEEAADVNLDAAVAGNEADAEGEENADAAEDSDNDEEIDLAELLKELEAEEAACPDCNKEDKEKEQLKKDLEEARKDRNEAVKTVKELKKTLSEVNLLNAKLLYSTRMLSKNNLTESQKAHCIKSFDKAKTPSEVKSIYLTLSEGIEASKKKVLKEHKGFASAPAGQSTKDNVVEADPFVMRMQQLAGIID